METSGLKVARGEEPADLLLKNARVVNALFPKEKSRIAVSKCQ
jgi:hypothetical protein